ncbi:MAG: hypothetical protein ACOY46_06315 [Bacillota bacterium]
MEVFGLKESIDRIIERLDRIDQRLDHQSSLLLALQHNSEVARAERESIIMAVTRLSGRLEEVNKLCEDILKRVNNIGLTQEFIKENIKDQALDITLLKKIISY